MSVEDDADRATLLTDFGVAAIYNGAAITVLFDYDHYTAESGEARVNTRRARAVARASDMVGVREGDLLSLDGRSWRINGTEPDGQGMIELALSLA